MTMPLLASLAMRMRESHARRVFERTRERLATQASLVLTTTKLIEAITDLESARANYHHVKEGDHD